MVLNLVLKANAAPGIPSRRPPSKKCGHSTLASSSQKRPLASGPSLELRPPPEKSRRISAMAHSTVTSSQPTSARNIGEVGPYSRLIRVARALRPSAPKLGLLPCRVAERKKIATFLRSGVEQGGSGQILYVSGMPGTGKTAIVLEALSLLRQKRRFDLAHVNAMRLGAPNQVFKDTADQLLPERTSFCGARSALSQYFSSRQASDSVVVLLIDEVDCLVTSNQAILYRIFDWLQLPDARLVLVAISNTMDLPERLLPRVASRFHIERVDFAPYNKGQLYEILRNRLESQNAVDCFFDVVLKLCAARVAGASGDVRKALQICRRAIEAHIEAGLEGTITLADLHVAEKDLVLANPAVKAIMGLSCLTRRFLAAVVIELQRSGAQTISLRQAAQFFQRLLSMVAMDDERGSSAPTLNSDLIDIDEIDEYAEQLMQRLEPMSILKQTKFGTSADALPGMGVSLGSLNEDEIVKALLQVEEDSYIRELLQGGEPDMDTQRHRYQPPDIGQLGSEAKLVQTVHSLERVMADKLLEVLHYDKWVPLKGLVHQIQWSKEIKKEIAQPQGIMMTQKLEAVFPAALRRIQDKVKFQGHGHDIRIKFHLYSLETNIADQLLKTLSDDKWMSITDFPAQCSGFEDIKEEIKQITDDISKKTFLGARANIKLKENTPAEHQIPMENEEEQEATLHAADAGAEQEASEDRTEQSLRQAVLSLEEKITDKLSRDVEWMNLSDVEIEKAIEQIGYHIFSEAWLAGLSKIQDKVDIGEKAIIKLKKLEASDRAQSFLEKEQMQAQTVQSLERMFADKLLEALHYDKWVPVKGLVHQMEWSRDYQKEITQTQGIMMTQRLEVVFRAALRKILDKVQFQGPEHDMHIKFNLCSLEKIITDKLLKTLSNDKWMSFSDLPAQLSAFEDIKEEIKQITDDISKKTFLGARANVKLKENTSTEPQSSLENEEAQEANLHAADAGADKEASEDTTEESLRQAVLSLEEKMTDKLSKDVEWMSFSDVEIEKAIEQIGSQIFSQALSLSKIRDKVEHCIGEQGIIKLRKLEAADGVQSLLEKELMQDDSAICELFDELFVDPAVDGGSGCTVAEGIGDQQVHARKKQDVHDDGDSQFSAEVEDNHHEKQQIEDSIDVGGKMLQDGPEILVSQPCAEIGFSQRDDDKDVAVNRGAEVVSVQSCSEVEVMNRLQKPSRSFSCTAGAVSQSGAESESRESARCRSPMRSGDLIID